MRPIAANAISHFYGGRWSWMRPALTNMWRAPYPGAGGLLGPVVYPCRQMAPAFAQAARELEPRVRLAKLNTEDHQAIAARYAIRSIPTMIPFQQGREVARISARWGADIVRWIRSVV